MHLETDLYLPNGSSFRLRPEDLDVHVSWQAELNTRLPPGSPYVIEIGHNGNGDKSKSPPKEVVANSLQVTSNGPWVRTGISIYASLIPKFNTIVPLTRHLSFRNRLALVLTCGLPLQLLLIGLLDVWLRIRWRPGSWSRQTGTISLISLTLSHMKI